LAQIQSYNELFPQNFPQGWFFGKAKVMENV